GGRLVGPGGRVGGRHRDPGMAPRLEPKDLPDPPGACLAAGPGTAGTGRLGPGAEGLGAPSQGPLGQAEQGAGGGWTSATWTKGLARRQSQARNRAAPPAWRRSRRAWAWRWGPSAFASAR